MLNPLKKHDKIIVELSLAQLEFCWKHWNFAGILIIFKHETNNGYTQIDIGNSQSQLNLNSPLVMKKVQIANGHPPNCSEDFPNYNV